jgi:hypothetical protein
MILGCARYPEPKIKKGLINFSAYSEKRENVPSEQSVWLKMSNDSNALLYYGIKIAF